MKTNLKQPEVTPLSKGKELKVLQVTAEAGAMMPPQYSTKEAVVTIIDGNAILEMNGEETILKKGTTFLIPEKQTHSLTAITKLLATVVMPIDSFIEFAK